MCNACIFTENVIPFARCKATAQFWCGLAPDGVGIPAVTINPASVLCDVAMSVITPAHPVTNATDPHENWTSRMDDWRSSPVLLMLTIGWLALFTCITYAYGWLIGALHLYYLCLRLVVWRSSHVLLMLKVGCRMQEIACRRLHSCTVVVKQKLYIDCRQQPEL
jgi:hypothetical protein